MRVLITRAEPAASRTADRLLGTGFDPVIFPLFELTDTGQELSIADQNSIIFTSANAIEVLKRRGWKPPNSLRTAWCVGEQTASMAVELGFECVEKANGGGSSLAKMISESVDARQTSFLYPTTPDRSFDMPAALERHGAKVTQVEIYQTTKVSPDREKFQQQVQKCRDGAALVYSRRSGKHLAKCIEHLGDKSLTQSITIIGISQTATEPFHAQLWKGVYSSEKPDEHSVFVMLNEISKA